MLYNNFFKLSIWACEVTKSGSVIPKRHPPFIAMLNPENYKIAQSINYDTRIEHDSKKTAPGPATKSPKFESYGNETVSFTLWLDASGVIQDLGEVSSVVGIGSHVVGVVPQVLFLEKVCYFIDGKNHEPNIVQLIWGSFLFNGRLTTMDVDYTLFSPLGVALRAKINLTFVSYKSINHSLAEANMSSPDLTHLVEVKAGDSLPLMCYQIYKDSTYYLEVAKVNGITNFRDIKPGTRLNFPPLR